eukprot:GHVU01083614.1.p1 GENE.GHVU01083614.1~~GHVU01083614.1.p1  ORF type:complete len:106 (-),score=2.25 GHVU01083614.1:1409-1726(-)
MSLSSFEFGARSNAPMKHEMPNSLRGLRAHYVSSHSRWSQVWLPLKVVGACWLACSNRVGAWCEFNVLRNDNMLRRASLSLSIDLASQRNSFLLLDWSLPPWEGS